jgi:hypothetical protein
VTYHPGWPKAHNNEKIGHQSEDDLEHIERSRAYVYGNSSASRFDFPLHH